jgi:MFS family permease
MDKIQQIASHSVVFIMGRVILGIGTAGICPVALRIISCCVSVRQQSSCKICFSLTCMAVAVAKLAIVGALIDWVTWRWTFYFNLPIGASVLGIVTVLFRPPRNVFDGRWKRDPLIIACFIVLPLIPTLLVLNCAGRRYPLTSAQIIALFVLSGFFLFPPP